MTGRRSRSRPTSVLAASLAVALGACHSAAVQPEPKPAPGTYPLDGVYTFRLDYREGTRARLVSSGQFVIADSQVLWSSPACEEEPAPEGSAGHQEAWFDCGRPSSRERLQFRINRTDPINESRWYGDVRILERVRTCSRYAATGACDRYGEVMVSRFVPRSGKLNVTRGLPEPPPDGGTSPGSPRTLRAGCDTGGPRGCAARR